MPSYDSVDTREPALACLYRGQWRDGRVLRGRELVYRQGPGSNDDSGQSSTSHRSASHHFHSKHGYSLSPFKLDLWSYEMGDCVWNGEAEIAGGVCRIRLTWLRNLSLVEGALSLLHC
jgi:hypothetical protein